MNKSPTKTPFNPNNDVILNDPPNDSIQALKWSPKANLLAVASWDCIVCKISKSYYIISYHASK